MSNKQNSIGKKWVDTRKIQVNFCLLYLDSEAVVKQLKENFSRKDN